MDQVTKKKKSGKGCLWIIVAVAIFCVMFMIRYTNSKQQLNPEDKAYFEQIEKRNRKEAEARHQVKKYLKDHLKDPKSYEGIEWYELNNETSSKYTIVHKYRAKNSFGGYVIECKAFVMNDYNQITEVYDYTLK